MRLVHCRRCWQTTAFLSTMCTHCGEVDRFRVVRGLGELLVYIAAIGVGIVLTLWIASSFY